MTAIGEWADISAGHGVPKTIGNLIGMRACLGASFVDSDFAAQFAEVKRREPGAVTLDYIFLAGPLRVHSAIPDQIAFYAKTHKADLACLDWERDEYTDPVTHETINLGIQPFLDVLVAIDECRKHGLNPGVYGFKAEMTPPVVKALIARKVPFLWVAGFDGVQLDPWLVQACATAGLPLFHQYTGTSLDRSRTLVGTLEQLHALAGRALNPAPGDAPSSGDGMFNLAPATTHRDAVLKAGTVLYADSALTVRHSSVSVETPLAFLGSGAAFHAVVNAGETNYVRRADAVRIVTNDRESV